MLSCNYTNLTLSKNHLKDNFQFKVHQFDWSYIGSLETKSFKCPNEILEDYLFKKKAWNWHAKKNWCLAAFAQLCRWPTTFAEKRAVVALLQKRKGLFSPKYHTIFIRNINFVVTMTSYRVILRLLKLTLRKLSIQSLPSSLARGKFVARLLHFCTPLAVGVGEISCRWAKKIQTCISTSLF